MQNLFSRFIHVKNCPYTNIGQSSTHHTSTKLNLKKNPNPHIRAQTGMVLRSKRTPVSDIQIQKGFTFLQVNRNEKM